MAETLWLVTMHSARLLRRDARQWGFTSGIDVENKHRVGKCESAGKFLQQGLGPAVAMRLKIT